MNAETGSPGECTLYEVLWCGRPTAFGLFKSAAEAKKAIRDHLRSARDADQPTYGDYRIRPWKDE